DRDGRQHVVVREVDHRDAVVDVVRHVAVIAGHADVDRVLTGRDARLEDFVRGADHAERRAAALRDQEARREAVRRGRRRVAGAGAALTGLAGQAGVGEAGESLVRRLPLTGGRRLVADADVALVGGRGAVAGDARGAGARRAGVADGAEEAVLAGEARVRREDAPGDRVAGVDGAGVQVVADERRPRGAEPGPTRLGAVAGRAVQDGGVDGAEEGVGGVRGAGVRIGAVERDAGAADRAEADLVTVADVAVAARGAVDQRRADAAEDRIAGVRRAEVAVV